MSSPSDPNGCTGLSWTYDPWGNRTSQVTTGGSCYQQPATTFTTQNQFPAASGYTYDTAGNMTYDGYHTYFYDAENRLAQVDGTFGTCSSATACYIYDVDGRRVEKATGSTYLDYVYDQAGNVLTEWCTNCGGYTGPTTEYIFMARNFVAEYKNDTTYFPHADHLGSTRLLTALDQSVVQNLDYLPFGELNSSDSGTTTHKFTFKERDSESGLDNFGKRYFGSSLARFMTPDPLLNSAHPDDPTSWNRYSYVANNPLRSVDPNGLFTWQRNCDELNDFTCHQDRQRFRDALDKLREADKNLQAGSQEKKNLDKILKRIGEENKGSVKIAFGDAGKDKNGNSNLGVTLGNTITINWSAVNNVTTAFGVKEVLPIYLDAGLVGHEGGHLSNSGFLGIGTLPGLSLLMHREAGALYSESTTYQGLSYTDKVYFLWNNSWAGADRSVIESHRQDAIQHELQRQKGVGQSDNPQ